MLSIYQPQAQILPASFKLKRVQTIIVYDVFRTPNGTKIIAICPPLHSLHKHLFPLEIFLENNPIKHRLSIYPIQRIDEANYFIEIDIPQFLQNKKTLKLDFQWKCFQHEYIVQPNPFAQATTSNMALCTLQKGNPIEWIEDWIFYHHNVHHVDQIVLYDNGSNNFDELYNALSDLDLGLKINLIQWRFPYPLAQLGALNHCYQILGETSRYYLNFDIDEYLVNTSHKSLLEILDGETTNNFLNLSVPGYWVEAILNKNLSSEKNFRVTDFLYNRKGRQSPCSPKTIFATQGLAYLHVHNNYTFSNQQQCLSIAQKPYTLSYIELKLKQWLIRQEIFYSGEFFSRKIRPKIKKIVALFRKKTHNNENELEPKPCLSNKYSKQVPRLYFNHYCGLTTGWNTLERLNFIRYKPSDHKIDTAMQSMLSCANLKDSKK